MLDVLEKKQCQLIAFEDHYTMQCQEHGNVMAFKCCTVLASAAILQHFILCIACWSFRYFEQDVRLSCIEGPHSSPVVAHN